MEPVALSTVIITRNQEAKVARVVRSVLDEPLTEEVIVVDSASSDSTVDQAGEFQIKVVQFLDGQPLSPAGGRRVGFELTSGEFVLFLDGDMELLPGWTRRAVDLLSSRPDVAAVAGRVVNVIDDEPANPVIPDGRADVTELRCRHTGGMAMYRRSALEQVGGFHPYLHSDEEPELCLRIRRAGFRFLRLALPAALHFTGAPTLSGLVERRRRRLYLGQGQVIRLLLRDRLLFAYLRERGYAIAPAVVLASGLVAATASVGRRDVRPGAAWLTGVTLVMAGYTARNRSFSRTAHSLLHRVFILEGAARGFLSGADDPASFSPRLRTIS